MKYRIEWVRNKLTGEICGHAITDCGNTVLKLFIDDIFIIALNEFSLIIGHRTDV